MNVADLKERGNKILNVEKLIFIFSLIKVYHWKCLQSNNIAYLNEVFF